MKDIFEAISDRITAEVPAVRWVDFDLGQLAQEKPPVSYPCALVAFSNGDYTQIGNDANSGSITIQVALGFRVWERTHSAGTLRETGLQHLDTVDAVRTALTGLVGGQFTGLQYAGFAQDQQADPRIWRLRFRTEHYPAPPASPFVPITDLTNVPTTLMVMPDFTTSVNT